MCSRCLDMELIHFRCIYNNLDESVKIKFTMQIADSKGLEFLDLLLKFDKNKIEVDVYAKPTNSFTYVLPTTCYPTRSINDIPKGIALLLRRICDSDKRDRRPCHTLQEWYNLCLTGKYQMILSPTKLINRRSKLV